MVKRHFAAEMREAMNTQWGDAQRALRRRHLLERLSSTSCRPPPSLRSHIHTQRTFLSYLPAQPPHRGVMFIWAEVRFDFEQNVP